MSSKLQHQGNCEKDFLCFDVSGVNKRFLQWARGHPKLKVVTADVPPGIFPVGIHGVLYDVKVFVRRGPDDAVYDSDSEIRAKVARGNCLLELQNCREAGTHCVTYAMKKFTGGLGDDDDREKGDNHTWKRYFTKTLDEAKHVICTRKANGEAAHLSAIRIRDQIYLIAGSKNVHLMFKCAEEIEKYSGDRYRIAKEVSETIMQLLDNISSDKKSGLLRYLCDNNVTAIFEILHPEHQHVEDLSYLKKPELNFIAWTSNNIDPSDKDGQKLCYMSPDKAIEIAREFGLSTVQYDKISASDVEERMRSVRLGYRYEGEVLYFVDQSDDVIGLLKKKTIWYIVCRAIREKIRRAAAANYKNKSDFNISKSRKQIEARIKEIQSWLNLDDMAVAKWIDLGCAYLGWSMHKMDRENISPDKLTSLFPVYWSEFLKEHPEKSDKIVAQWEEPAGSYE